MSESIDAIKGALAAMEQRLYLLEEHQSILQTMYQYGYSLDYGTEADFVDCYHERATLHWADDRSFEGHAEIARAFQSHTHAPDVYHKHLVIQPRITIEGDDARATSYFVRLDRYRSGPKIRSFGRYHDVLIRCDDGRWRFLERRLELEARRSELGEADEFSAAQTRA